MEECVNKLCQAITIIANVVYFTLSILSYSEYSSFLYLGFIAKRVYKNNTVVLHHLIEYIVPTRRMHKHQYVAVKHLERTF